MTESTASPSASGAVTTTTTGGRCLCGAVSFRAALPSRWVAHCHCSRCQRAHGAGFVTWVGLDADRVTLEDPARALRWYVAETGAERAFCANCGSPMFFRSAQWPGELHAARALFTQPVDREPQMHAYYDTHVDWITLGDALPRRPGPDDA
jgi:hypothetical protein